MLETEKINLFKNKNISEEFLRTRQKSQLCWVLEPILKEAKNFLKPDFIFFLRFRGESSEDEQEKPSSFGEIKFEVWLDLGEDLAVKQSLLETIETEGQALLFPLGLHNQQTTIVSEIGFESKTKTSGTCKSFIFVPLMKNQQMFGGILGMWCKQKHTFTNWEIKGAEILASYVSMSIQSFDLKFQLGTQVNRVKALLELSTTIYSSLNYKVVLEKVIHYAKKLAEADGCTIYILDREKQTLKPWLSNYEEFRDQIMKFELKIGEGATGKAAQSGMAIISNFADQDHRTVQIPGTPDEPESLMSVPLMWSGEVIGVITINAKGHRRFSDDDLNLLTIFARHVSDAIENARLFDNLERAYKELNEAQQQLVQSERLRALGEMAGGVAHDFNNILGAILGRVQLLLLNDKIEEKLKYGLNLIEKSALDGAETVRRIQEFTRVHKFTYLSKVDLNQIVEDALEMTQPKWKDEAQQRGVDIKVDKQLKELKPVAGVASELTEVVANMILNSVDALPEGGTITLKTYRNQDSVYIEIQDTGSGMSDEVKGMAFEPFFTTKGKQGTGLGLSVAYGIISRHKGEITIDSQEGKGTTFKIRLPLQEITAEAKETPSPKILDRKMRILVVDDDPNIQDILQDILSLEGHQVQLAPSGDDALKLFKSSDFEVVITDLGMPGMSGWELAKEVKKSKSKIIVILITGWRAQLDTDKIKESGIDFILPKPFHIEQIKEVLHQTAAKITP
ncbi:MAG: GAF sensor hybrid histidine kinase [candidate division Zixibacteria bacterium RBG-1]|nr:MAG: GAF sensor hybrid histidine kinase [candidate division Zixibacteria bacterium RBG-1]OGC84518.1 MAG: hypothetical protein A2V73_01675 [candidate division Zixibacteria bacterium RBG_19FT_COMBO_42_43]